MPVTMDGQNITLTIPLHELGLKRKRYIANFARPDYSNWTIFSDLHWAYTGYVKNQKT